MLVSSPAMLAAMTPEKVPQCMANTSTVTATSTAASLWSARSIVRRGSFASNAAVPRNTMKPVMNMVFLLYGFGLGFDSAQASTMSLLACWSSPGSFEACALDARKNLNVASATDLTALPELVAGAVLLMGMPCMMFLLKVQTKTAPKWVLRDTDL